MKQTKLQRLEKIRAIGKGSFILKYGGLIVGLMGFGILGQVLVFTINFITNDYNFSFLDEKFKFDLIRRFIFAFPIGCLWGWVMWKFNERIYLKAKRNSK
jgi:hypothetical protein